MEGSSELFNLGNVGGNRRYSYDLHSGPEQSGGQELALPFLHGQGECLL